MTGKRENDGGRHQLGKLSDIGARFSEPKAPANRASNCGILLPAREATEVVSELTEIAIEELRQVIGEASP